MSEPFSKSAPRKAKIWHDLWIQPDGPRGYLDSWLAKYYAWRMIYFCGGLFSISFPAIAAATHGNATSVVFPVAATITSGVVAFLGANDQEDKFNVAWHLLRMAVESGDDVRIREAVLRGESIINGGALQKYAPDMYMPAPPRPRPTPQRCIMI